MKIKNRNSPIHRRQLRSICIYISILMCVQIKKNAPIKVPKTIHFFHYTNKKTVIKIVNKKLVKEPITITK